jgi:hypothetical protein
VTNELIVLFTKQPIPDTHVNNIAYGKKISKHARDHVYYNNRTTYLNFSPKKINQEPTSCYLLVWMTSLSFTTSVVGVSTSSGFTCLFAAADDKTFVTMCSFFQYKYN